MTLMYHTPQMTKYNRLIIDLTINQRSNFPVLVMRSLSLRKAHIWRIIGCGYLTDPFSCWRMKSTKRVLNTRYVPSGVQVNDKTWSPTTTHCYKAKNALFFFVLTLSTAKMIRLSTHLTNGFTINRSIISNDTDDSWLTSVHYWITFAVTS